MADILTSFVKFNHDVVVAWLPSLKRFSVMVEDNQGCSQWPIQYDDETIAYDFPERISQDQKEEVRRAFNALRGRPK